MPQAWLPTMTCPVKNLWLDHCVRLLLIEPLFSSTKLLYTASDKNPHSVQLGEEKVFMRKGRGTTNCMNGISIGADKLTVMLILKNVQSDSHVCFLDSFANSCLECIVL